MIMNKDQKFKRKRIRIKEFDYTGCHAYFVTICTFNKETYFKNEKIINKILNYLKPEADRLKFLIYAYCFMPDHLHLLLIGEKESNLLNFIKCFKQKTGYCFKQEFKKTLWQKSFFDHVIRKEKAINDITGYIFNNPVRKGTVDDFRKYPYLGSFVIDVNELHEIYTRREKIDLNFIFSR